MKQLLQFFSFLIFACFISNLHAQDLTSFSDEQTFLYGFKDEAGKIIVPAQYDRVNRFSQQRALVEKGGKFGFVDPAGREVIPCQLERAWTFSEGRALFRTGEKFGYLDLSGKPVIAAQFDAAKDFKHNRAVVGKIIDGNKKYTLIDSMNQLNLPFKYGFIDDFHWDAAIAELDGKYYVIDLNGKPKSAAFDELNYLYDSHPTLIAKKAGLFGLLNANGEIVLDVIYSKMELYAWGYVVEKDGKFGMYNLDGKPLSEVKYETFGENFELRIKVSLHGKYGYLDLDGKLIIPAIYDAASNFRDGKAQVKKGDKVFFIDLAGNQVH